MESGQTVYKGEVYTTGALRGDCVRYYIQKATATGIVADGVPMARMHEILVPLRDYVATEAEAKRQIVEALEGLIASVRETSDKLMAEIAK